MFYTTRYDGYDTQHIYEKTTWGSVVIQALSSGLLRLGVLLKWIGLTGLLFSYYIYEGQGLFTYDLKDTTEAQRELQGFRCSLTAFQFVHLLGALYLLGFQTFLADDASWSRGYRAGSKMFGTAATFDVISSTLQFIIYVYMDNYYDKTWWAHFTSGGAEWLISTLARLLNAFALFYYASGFFLLEVYHDNGTNDWHGVLNAFILTFAGIAEISVLVLSEGSISIVLHWIALVSILVWAMAFEQELNSSQPFLHESEFTNQVESQVEKFARNSPYANPAQQQNPNPVYVSAY